MVSTLQGTKLGATPGTDFLARRGVSSVLRMGVTDLQGLCKDDKGGGGRTDSSAKGYVFLYLG